MQAILHIGSGNALERLELYKFVAPTMELDGSVRVTHFEVPDLLRQTTPGHTYPPARGWTAALIDTARGTAVTAEPAHGRRRERRGSGSSENAPPAQRRKTHPAKASLPVPPALSLEEGLRVVHANGLVVEDQIAISSLRGTGNTCPSHAANQAFQGDAVGLALEGVHIGEIEAAIARDFGIAMQVMTAMHNPGEWIDGEHDLEMMADRLERGGTAIVELGGQDYTSGVTQHFVTLVRHAGDGRFHLLDSLNAHGVRSFATAREALRALAMVNELAGGRWALSALMPAEGRVLPPAQWNPRGAYLPERGFVPLADLQEEELQRVAEMHGPEARSRLEQVMAQHAGVAYGAGFLGQPVLVEAIPAAGAASQLGSKEPHAGWGGDGNQYGVWANRPGDEHPQSVSVALSGHGNDIDAARRAAEDIAARTFVETDVHEPKPWSAEEYVSDVRGVRWQEAQNRWIVQTTGPNDDKVQVVSFPVKKYDNDVVAARNAAEDIARRIQAGTYVHQPKPRPPAEYSSDVPGVNWESGRKRWLVRITCPGDDKAQIVPFPIRKYDNDVMAAKEAAESIAAKIHGRTYVHQPKRRGLEHGKRR